MEPNFIETLTDEEAQQLRDGIEELKQRVLSGRQNARIAELTENYRRDMIAARGKPGMIRQIKERARLAGVPVDRVDFS